ncbi:MAG TPA: glycosyl hydrolase [Armatimonadota bacterium]|jgi:hypothetical protein
MKTGMRCLLWFAAVLSLSSSALAGALETGFHSPPPSARPWVYWFWLNGNITREGITADLEAMERVGIGGVLIMEVDQGAPRGPVDFMGAQWRALFAHAASEAKRLGLEINMNNDAGWNGSGGPWIKPEQSMQKVVWSETSLAGPQRFEGTLPQPQTVAGFYRDIEVLAFPTPGPYRIPDIQVKAAYQVGAVGAAEAADLAPEMVIDTKQVTDITSRMDATGRVNWDVPAGNWTVMRFGHTSTGAVNAPAPETGRGLECDKLSVEGAEANFGGMMAKLVADTGSAPGKALVATHVDSWENGSQNWTARMRDEFRHRRGYDPLPFLPVMTGRVVGSAEVSERFLWDLRRTISELVVQNYAGRIRGLAHANGLRFTTEAYGGPCDDLPYGGQADEPMGEFWMGGGSIETCRGMASAAHVYGKPIVGAESFTAGSDERWLQHPASIKSLGDRAFCEGINRFVFHRYAMQPWVDNRRPGMTMGPWGLHYERTQTWWNQSAAWHTYLARCQQLLRQGRYAADICYLQAEAPPQAFNGHRPAGYAWDECPAEAVLTRMTVKNGRIVLPDGMSYRVLVLSESRNMTPALLRKLGDLVKAGATVIGPRPLKSPSLSGYPQCDDEVKRLADEIWGDCDGKGVKEHRYGLGRVIWGVAPEKILSGSGTGPDFTGGQRLNWIHRTVGTTEIYFLANPQAKRVAAACTFRVSGKTPELWWPEAGRIERAPIYRLDKGATTVLLPLGPSESVFVVFRSAAAKSDPVMAVKRGGTTVLSLVSGPALPIVVKRASYGVLGDPARTRDVRAEVQRLADSGEREFQVAEMAAGDDPAYGIVKTLIVDYTLGGKRATARGVDPERIDLDSFTPDTAPQCELAGSGSLERLTVWQPGRYTVVRASGRAQILTMPDVPAALSIGGPWTVSFPPGNGAPERIRLERLASLSDYPDPGVKYFSGTAVWRTTIHAPAGAFGNGRTMRLELGDVQVIAEVKLNGKGLGILWKPPYSVDVTAALKPGVNSLEVKVTNLWPNRLVGDEQLPEDSDRNGDGTLKSWPQWLIDGKPSPTGRLTFTSWRLWRKDDALLPSGLLGPVTIRAGRTFVIE